MTLSNLYGFNLLSPYGKVTRYVPLEYKGFFLHPKSDAAPEGWTYDPAGEQPEKPGKPSGDKPYRFIGKPPASAWSCVHTPGDFFYGEIDWRGPVKDSEAAHRGRYRVSFHAPKSRYFTEPGFFYGSDASHNNVYSEGRCIAVAPYPVLGACLSEQTNPAFTAWDGTGPTPPEKVWYVLVVCTDGSQDMVYRRPLGGSVRRAQYTDEYRASAMRLYNAESNPQGWEVLGAKALNTSSQGTACEVHRPTTPWFFNESGTEAACVRECSLDVDRGALLGTKRRSGYNLFTVKIDSSASFTDLRNYAGYSTTIDTSVEKLPEYRVETRYPYSESNEPIAEHSWDIYYLKQKVRCQGRYTIGVDYVGDNMRRIDIVADINRYRAQYMYIGTDPAPHPEEYSRNVDSNRWDIFGDGFNELPPSEEETPRNISSARVGVDDRVYLEFSDDTEDLHWIYRRLSGSRQEFLTGVPDTAAQYLYFLWKLNTYPHNLDVRTPHLLTYVEEVAAEDLTLTGGADVVLRTVEAEQHYFVDNGKDYKVFMERKKPDDNIPASGYPLGVGQGWLYDRLPLPAGYPQNPDPIYALGTHTAGYKDVSYTFPEDLQDKWPNTVPSLLEAYYGTYYTVDDGLLPITEQTQSIAKNLRNGGYGVDDFRNAAVSMEYTDHENKTKYYNYLSGGTLAGVTSAYGENLKFYSIGVS